MKLSLLIIILIQSVLSGCLAQPPLIPPATATVAITRQAAITTLIPTLMPTRPIYQPGQLVDYAAQMGDTLPALAARFNTSVYEIRTANPLIPENVTTMPPGMPMKIPIYYQPFWGSSFEMIPDSLFVNGPSQQGFDPVAFVNGQPGWLKSYSFYTGERSQKGGELIAQVSTDYSLSPRLLLALIEYQTGALSQPEMTDPENVYPLGFNNPAAQGLYRQLLLAADLLNDGFYSWREGRLKEFLLKDGRLQRLDPWLNASGAALQYYFSKVYTHEVYIQAILGSGLSLTYQKLFGDPWKDVQPNIPVNLRQPDLRFPFPPGHTWAFTGGPHTGYGETEPYAAIDFAPGTLASGCSPSNEYATALADGVVVRTDPANAVLDLDGDGDERTGWVIYYLHLADAGKVQLGARLHTGDPMGHPSCEGGRATGTHVHIARKYNGEWIPADGPLAFILEGWIVQRGRQAYEGTLVRGSASIRACTCSDQSTHVKSGE